MSEQILKFDDDLLKIMNRMLGIRDEEWIKLMHVLDEIQTERNYKQGDNNGTHQRD